MKKITAILWLFFLVVVCSCAPRVVSPVAWTFQKEGIVLHLHVNSRLHHGAGDPSPLSVLVYQLGSPVSFNRLVREEQGLNDILKGEKFDGSVVSVKRIRVLPASEGTYRIDRVEGAGHVGIVAAYPGVERQKMTRVYEVPLFVKKEGIFSSAGELVPGRLDVDVVLGAGGIEEKETVALKKSEGSSRD